MAESLCPLSLLIVTVADDRSGVYHAFTLVAVHENDGEETHEESGPAVSDWLQLPRKIPLNPQHSTL
jgi:hypothetical protein